ncbi:MAG: sigma-54-dependent Fis family transcriptional regulator, partial [bacterium]|nr:sigma-54-dependent Fis family transcriptional regulator [bacterium]
EIGELDPRSQVKLLRVLQDQTYEPLGSSATQHLDIRVISATNCDLNAAISEGSFREDLLYRINLMTLRLPSLAERPTDIPLLANHFLARAAAVFGEDRRPLKIASDALRWLQAQPWPGNVRQLAQFLARAVLVACDHTVDIGTCEQVAVMDSARSESSSLPPVGTMTVDEIEKAMIEKSLRYHDGNLSRAAESLGLSRAALYRRLEKYRIET